jgi:hypothetical protein
MYQLGRRSMPVHLTGETRLLTLIARGGMVY